MNKDRVLKLNLDHVLVDLVENGSYLFVLQFLDGYYYFARKVTSQDNNDHPPMRAGQHLLFSLFLIKCVEPELLVANATQMVELAITFLPIYISSLFCVLTTPPLDA